MRRRRSPDSPRRRVPARRSWSPTLRHCRSRMLLPTLLIAFMPLQDMDDAPAALREAPRILLPGGRLVVAIVHPLHRPISGVRRELIAVTSTCGAPSTTSSMTGGPSRSIRFIVPSMPGWRCSSMPASPSRTFASHDPALMTSLTRRSPRHVPGPGSFTFAPLLGLSRKPTHEMWPTLNQAPTAVSKPLRMAR